MDVTRERICGILELREILLSFQTSVNLLKAAVVCAILEGIPGLEPSTVLTEPRHLKLVSVSRSCPFILISVLVCSLAVVIVKIFFESHNTVLLSCFSYLVLPFQCTS